MPPAASSRPPANDAGGVSRPDALRRFLVGVLAAFGAASLLFTIAVAVFVWQLTRSSEPDLPDSVVLHMDLRAALPETKGDAPLAALGLGSGLDVVDALLALRAARDDPRVKGVVARFDGGGPGFAQAQELRDAIAELNAAGKTTLAFADAFGEFGPGMQGYYLASAFGEVVLQPLGAVGLTGLMIETPLLRGLLENLGIEPVGDKRGAYKSAAETFTERELSPASREALEAILDSVFGQIANGIAETRGLQPSLVAELLGRGPYAADEALEAGLVDRLGYWDEVEAWAIDLAGGDEGVMPLARYPGAGEAPETAPVVALIHGVGQITRGDSEQAPTGGLFLGADTVADAFDDAIEDAEVQAILFRVDSPGGSAVASETIGRQVERAVAAGKPVVVSMGDVAASGGYWISMDASAITARPATLTGSIGVFAGKPVLRELWQDIGVAWGRVQRGENADMWSTSSGFDAAGEERLEAFLDRTYAAFTEGVAEGRGLDRSAVLAAAEGRVWTGEQALELGLVDDLGGFAAALERVRETVGVAPGEPVALQRFPRPRGPFETVLEFLDDPLALLGGPALRLDLPLWSGPLSAPRLTVR